MSQSLSLQWLLLLTNLHILDFLNFGRDIVPCAWDLGWEFGRGSSSPSPTVPPSPSFCTPPIAPSPGAPWPGRIAEVLSGSKRENPGSSLSAREKIRESPCAPESPCVPGAVAVATTSILIPCCMFAANGQRLREWRNTPKEYRCSPSQFLYGHSPKTKTSGVIPDGLFGPNKTSGSSPGHQDKKSQIQGKGRRRHDAHASNLKSLCPRQRVHIKDPMTKLWDKTWTITRHHANKILLFNGKCEQKFIRLFQETKDSSLHAGYLGGETKESSTYTTHKPRRSTRATRPPV